MNANEPVTAMTLLTLANAILTVVAGYFIRVFVQQVRELVLDLQRTKLAVHGRLVALEQKNGMEPGSIE